MGPGQSHCEFRDDHVYGPARGAGCQELISRFGVALGIGLLIGIERGWRAREAHPGSRTAGVRTFAITGLLGGVIGALAQALGGDTGPGGLVLGLGFAAYAAVFATFCRDEPLPTPSRRPPRSPPC